MSPAAPSPASGPAGLGSHFNVSEQCDRCSGTGIEDGTSLVCGRCYGVGIVLDSLVQASEDLRGING